MKERVEDIWIMQPPADLESVFLSKGRQAWDMSIGAVKFVLIDVFQSSRVMSDREVPPTPPV
jgi:hypothetical protein